MAASTGFDKIKALSAAVRFNSVVMKSAPGEAEEVSDIREMTGRRWAEVLGRQVEEGEILGGKVLLTGKKRTTRGLTVDC